jgi:phosphoribosyl 1,2-cyclic phosphodiesterase
MMLGMAGKAPLLLAAFLFGIGASGLVLLSLADRTAWGPFRPQVPPRPPQRVIVIDVGTRLRRRRSRSCSPAAMMHASRH